MILMDYKHIKMIHQTYKGGQICGKKKQKNESEGENNKDSKLREKPVRRRRRSFM